MDRSSLRAPVVRATRATKRTPHAGWALALAIVASVWEGWVISVLWRWFVVPQFHVAALSVGAAIGLGLVANLLTTSPGVKQEENGWWTVGMAYASPAVALVVGWVVLLVTR